MNARHACQLLILVAVSCGEPEYEEPRGNGDYCETSEDCREGFFCVTEEENAFEHHNNTCRFRCDDDAHVCHDIGPNAFCTECYVGGYSLHSYCIFDQCIH